MKMLKAMLVAAAVAVPGLAHAQAPQVEQNVSMATMQAIIDRKGRGEPQLTPRGGPALLAQRAGRGSASRVDAAGWPCRR